QLPVRALAVQRVLPPIRTEVLAFSRVELPADAIELVARNRYRDVVHAADRLPGRGHRILREVEKGEQVAVSQVVEEVGRAGQIAILEQLNQRETQHLAVELDGPLDIGADQRQMVNALGAGRSALRFWLQVGGLERLALGAVVNLGGGHPNLLA